ncbi:MAG: AsmA family protein [Rhodobacteraceae bacterium]|nr:MAG: AsmA family protein [Paracoccaceae bacterium]
MRWIFRLTGVAILLLAFAVGAVFFLPKERIAIIAADQVRAQTGRDLVVTGEIGFSFWPVLGVRTGPVTFSNADWAGSEPMVEAKGLSIGVDAAGLIGGDIRIRHIEAISPVVRLATRADGTGNWEFVPRPVPDGDTTGGTAEAGGTQPFTLEKLSVTDARLIFAPVDGERIDLAGVNLELDWPDPAGPATFAGSVSPAGEPVALSGRIEGFAAFLGGAVAPVSMEGGTAGGDVRFDGRASTAGEAAGNLNLKITDTGRALAALGLGAVDLPQGFGRALDMQAAVTVTADRRIALRDMALGLDGNRLTGAADITLAGKPNVTAQLTAGALDFSAAAAAGGGSGSRSGATGAGWSTARIDAEALGLFDGRIALTAASIDLGDYKLGQTEMGLTVERSRAVLQLGRTQIFDGLVSGQLVANNRNGLSVAGNLSATGIETRAMLGTLAGLTRLSGKAGAQVEFLGSGTSVDAIMNSLSGKGSLAMGRGLISGIDLDRLMRSGDATGGTTVFDSLTASWVIEGGNMLNRDLALLLSNYRAEGAGRIGLGARDIDYLFTPIALRANSGQGLAIPIRIRGPWSGPRIIPDLEEALKLDTSGKVEDVRQQAREKLQEELGVTPQEGQSTEDALRDALEDKAKDRLRRLLGGE